ncbi:MAG: type I restriction enzyme HsdR N-terminal domain-containing protein [Paramuribaculum sp.]|nr:type I restriction enzyme HsdR N-terminal domain-containing protein [Paramuribaculum sp.]MDE6651843.1 type I restriction enzyme HsdR N-terminal domain-containing protein [Paramuribaculum sp.]
MQPESNFPVLNLPESPQQVRANGNGFEIFDPLRKKWVALTPEEWVRQNFTSWLIKSKGYRASLMANEVGIKLNGMTRRCDTIVYNTSLKPVAIVEYKAPGVVINQQVFDQIARYNMVLGARILIVSNGIKHYCCRFDGSNSYSFIAEVPDYSFFSDTQNS